MAFDFKEGAKIGGRFAVGAAKEIAKAGASEVAFKVVEKIVRGLL